MQIIFRCKRCQRKMSTDAEYVGRKVRCPDCSTVLTVPEESEGSRSAIVAPPARQPTPAPTQAPPPPSSDAPFDFGPPLGGSGSGRAAPPPASGSAFDFTGSSSGGGGYEWGAGASGSSSTRLPKEWQWVRWGITVVGWGVIGILVYFAVSYLSFIMAFSGSGRVAGYVQIFSLIILVFSAIPILIGPFLCVGGPSEFGFKWVALGAGICLVLIVTSLIGFYAWLVFLLGVGNYFHNKRLVINVIIFIVATVLIPLLLVGVFFVVGYLLKDSPADAAFMFATIYHVAGLVVFAWLLGLHSPAQWTITRARMGMRT